MIPEKYEAYAYHGGAYDRGSADAYYWRVVNPHKWVDKKEVLDLTSEELEAYYYAYQHETDRKVWD